jgi:hypothetical protein
MQGFRASGAADNGEPDGRLVIQAPQTVDHSKYQKDSRNRLTLAEIGELVCVPRIDQFVVIEPAYGVIRRPRSGIFRHVVDLPSVVGSRN